MTHFHAIPDWLVSLVKFLTRTAPYIILMPQYATWHHAISLGITMTLLRWLYMESPAVTMMVPFHWMCSHHYIPGIQRIRGFYVEAVWYPPSAIHPLYKWCECNNSKGTDGLFSNLAHTVEMIVHKLIILPWYANWVDLVMEIIQSYCQIHK